MEGSLDFSLVGILDKISILMVDNKISILMVDNKISIFTISTYDTDYILINEESAESNG